MFLSSFPVQVFPMKSLPFFSCLALAVSGVLLTFSTAQDAGSSGASPIPLAQESSDIPTDEAVTWGVLDNGLRYAILPNAEPPNRVSLRLFVDAGSLMENGDQQGLAHFLEHMAFNGTTNFPSGEMVEYFQRLGMAFGSHTNAHTSFNETVYKLELPNTEPELLDEAFLLLRDYADGMKLGEAEIEKERGVILSEKRSRDSVGWRTFVEQFGFTLDGNLAAERLPIGTEEVIKNAPRERFVEFYEKWYTADRMAVLVVGDIEVAEIEPLIKTHFASLAPASEKVAWPDLEHVNQRGLAVHFHPEPEAGEVSVSIDTIRSRMNPPDDSAERARWLRVGLANQMLNRRISKLAKEEGSPIVSGSAYAYNLYDLNFAEYAGIEMSCQPANWEKALSLADQELRRALEHGFTEAELKEAKANLLNKAELGAKSKATRKSKDLANAIAKRIGERKVFTDPAVDLVRISEELEKVTLEETQAKLKEIWEGDSEVLLLVTGNVEIPEPKETILASYEESQAVAVEPPEQEEQKPFAYAELPEPGEVVEENFVDDLEVTQLRFGNNVRVNLKPTEFEDGTIYVKARFGGGKLVLPEDKAGLSLIASATFGQGGLEEHDYDEIQRLFAGKSVGVSLGVSDDSFTMSGRTTPDDLRDQLLLMRAFFTHPGYRSEPLGQMQRALDQMYQQIHTTPEGIMQDQVARFIHGGDKRFGYPKKEELMKLTMEDLRDWLAEPLASDYLEITVVGDIDPATVKEDLAATFGNLPERAAEKPAYAEARDVDFPRGEGDQGFGFETTIPKGMSLVYWPTGDRYEIQKSRRTGILGSILDDRLRKKIREELGDAYSPFAHNLPSDTFEDFGYLFAAVTVDPTQAEKVEGVIKEISAELGKGDTITQDELDRAKKPILTQLEEMRRTNRYWMGSVLESSQEYPQRLDWARSFVSDYESITLEEIQDLAREYLGDYEGLGILITPVDTEPPRK